MLLFYILGNNHNNERCIVFLVSHHTHLVAHLSLLRICRSSIYQHAMSSSGMEITEYTDDDFILTNNRRQSIHL
jgi:hypothetical protein